MDTAPSPLDDLTARHNARLAGIDPLLPGTPPAETIEGDVEIAVPGGSALARRTEVDPEAGHACWSTLVQHRLVRPRAAGDDPVGAMRGLVARWRAHLTGAMAGDAGETGAAVTWPSRDAVMSEVFIDAGMVPSAVVAARRAGRPGPAGDAPGVAIRRATMDDLDVVVELMLDVVRWDAQFGPTTMRAATPLRFREEATDLIEAADPSVWLALDGDRALGVLAVEWPERAGWVSGSVAGDPGRVAYVYCMSVRADRRGGGVGSALAGHAHGLLDAAGVETTLLHYAGLSPLSGPFWHRAGYRPLLTTWEVRPHTALR
jgi:GNAT superfamily N-acetyltransferase